MSRYAATAVGTLLMAAMCGGAAWAADQNDGAAEETVTLSLSLSKADCVQLLKNRTDGAAYKPGVDVRGNPVTGAEGTGAPPISVPDEITFSIGLDLEKKYGIGSTGAFSGEGAVGMIRVDRARGQVFWNDQLLDGDDAEALTQACDEAYGGQ